jgi:predicted nucleic acid-binding protein
MTIPASLNNSTVLLDTNFFIDAFSRPENFGELIFSLKKAGVALVSSSIVKFEFVRSKDQDVVQKKIRYFDELVENLLPIDRKTEDLIIEVMKEYKGFIIGVSPADIILAAFLKRYYKLRLLTRDHNDFPSSIFHREELFNIQLVRDVKTYAVYSYKSEANIPF